MENNLLDNDFQTPQATRKVEYAGFWIRVGATFIDFLAYSPIIVLNFYNLYSLKSLPVQLLTLVFLTLYKPWMEYQYGATLGKMAVKIKVVNSQYESINLEQAVKRFAPWLISQVISFYATIILFQSEAFAEATGWMEVGQIQNELTPTAISYFGSGLMLVSCLAVAFDDNKRGLHDMFAGTYCIYKDR
jgi:uncharacterized RDD family membrane protein YckC